MEGFKKNVEIVMVFLTISSPEIYTRNLRDEKLVVLKGLKILEVREV